MTVEELCRSVVCAGQKEMKTGRRRRKREQLRKALGTLRTAVWKRDPRVKMAVICRYRQDLPTHVKAYPRSAERGAPFAISYLFRYPFRQSSPAPHVKLRWSLTAESLAPARSAGVGPGRVWRRRKPQRLEHREVCSASCVVWERAVERIVHEGCRRSDGRSCCPSNCQSRTWRRSRS